MGHRGYRQGGCVILKSPGAEAIKAWESASRAGAEIQGEWEGDSSQGKAPLNHPLLSWLFGKSASKMSSVCMETKHN